MAMKSYNGKEKDYIAYKLSTGEKIAFKTCIMLVLEVVTAMSSWSSYEVL